MYKAYIFKHSIFLCHVLMPLLYLFWFRCQNYCVFINPYFELGVKQQLSKTRLKPLYLLYLGFINGVLLNFFSCIDEIKKSG